MWIETSGFYDADLIKQLKKTERDEKLEKLQKKKLHLTAAFAGCMQDLEKAKAENKKIIHLECCFDCAEHKWCTQHNQAKYDKFKSCLISEVAKELGNDWYVAVNCIEKVKLGSFEVLYEDKIYYSKIKTTMWPHVPTVVARIKNHGNDEVKPKTGNNEVEPKTGNDEVEPKTGNDDFE